MQSSFSRTHLKDLVGREIGVTAWIVVSPDRIRQFAEATEDRQWIHVDAERAKTESPYGTPIAHGFLTVSLLGFFLKKALQIRSGMKMAINYGLNRVRFPAPVLANSQIRARVTVLAAKEIENAVQATFGLVIECRETSKPCCVAEWILRYYAE